MNEVELHDFARYGIPSNEYMKLYFIGHHNPRGNHFFAYSIKHKIISWLDPKPARPVIESLGFAFCGI